MFKAEIDGIEMELEEKISILDAAKKAKINIPTLCYEEGLSIYGGCRLCVVEIEGEELLKPACATEIEDGMKIKTHSKKVRELRKNLFELIIATHNIDCQLNCLTCSRASNCELKEIAEDIGVSKMRLDPIKRGKNVLAVTAVLENVKKFRVLVFLLQQIAAQKLLLQLLRIEEWVM